MTEEEDAVLTELLYQVCVRFVGDLSLVTLFFGSPIKAKISDTPSKQPLAEFPVFSALIP